MKVDLFLMFKIEIDINPILQKINLTKDPVERCIFKKSAIESKKNIIVNITITNKQDFFMGFKKLVCYSTEIKYMIFR